MVALHLIGAIAMILLLRGGDAKARCLLDVYVLIQILGLIYIPIDREPVIADSVLILAYAMSPPVLRHLHAPRSAPVS